MRRSTRTSRRCASRAEYPGNCPDRVPVARRERHFEAAVQLAETSDGPHLSSIEAEHERCVVLVHFHEPVGTRREIQRQRRQRSGSAREDTHEANDVRAGWLACERIAAMQVGDVATPTDHDSGIEGEPACDLRAQLRAADASPYYE